MFEGNMWIFIGVCAILLLLLCIYFFAKRAKRTSYRTSIEALELRRYDISNKPVMFELAKLKSVRKSDRIIDLVAGWEKRWQALEEQLLTIEDNIAYAEESVLASEFDRADEIVEVTDKDLQEVSKKVNELLAEIENLKTSEFRNRDGIIKLRTLFSKLSSKFENNQPTYEEVKPEIQKIFRQVEADFATFDKHMEGSNYDLADEVSEKLQIDLEVVKKAMEKIPMYRESMEIDIEPMLESILESRENMVENGLYLEHLQVEFVVDNCKKELDRVQGLLKRFKFIEIEKLLMNVSSEAKKLRDAMKHELDVKDAFELDLQQLKVDSAFVIKEAKTLNERYDLVKESCLMRTDDEENFKLLIREIGIVEAGIGRLFSEIEVGESAISDLHTSVLGYLGQLGEISEQLRIFDEEIANLQKGSSHIKEQAFELLNRMNRLKSNFEKSSIDKKVSSYKLTLDKADNQVSELLVEASKIPLDVAKANFSLKVSTEMVEKAEHEVTLAIEQVNLAERLLIYGNRYVEREGVFLMDLTIAEDQFQQGNYESVIDKMYKILADVEGEAFSGVFEELKQELGCKVL